MSKGPVDCPETDLASWYEVFVQVDAGVSTNGVGFGWEHGGGSSLVVGLTFEDGPSTTVGIDVVANLRNGDGESLDVLSKDDAGLNVVCNCCCVSSFSLPTLMPFMVIVWPALGCILSSSSSSSTSVKSH